MHVYRIGWAKYGSDLSGEGARLHGGRWNHKGTPLVYASESRALALLEYTVNVNIEEIPRALSLTTIEIPDDLIKTVSIADLPGNWQMVPAPSSTRDRGTAWFHKSKHAILRVPSSILPHEYNYLLNPLHPLSHRWKSIAVEDFVYDVRIKLK
jgi:RES domain-containing protein